MMMNRDKLSFWVRLVSIVLAAFFLISFIFLGLGTNISYNLFELIGNQDQQQQQADQAPEPADAIEYFNGYLDLEPKGENAKQVKERISALLEGGDSSGSAGP